MGRGDVQVHQWRALRRRPRWGWSVLSAHQIGREKQNKQDDAGGCPDLRAVDDDGSYPHPDRVALEAEALGIHVDPGIGSQEQQQAHHRGKGLGRHRAGIALGSSDVWTWPEVLAGRALPEADGAADPWARGPVRGRMVNARVEPIRPGPSAGTSWTPRPELGYRPRSVQLRPGASLRQRAPGGWTREGDHRWPAAPAGMRMPTGPR